MYIFMILGQFPIQQAQEWKKLETIIEVQTRGVKKVANLLLLYSV